MRSLRLSYQTRLILGFAGICLLIGLLSLGVGISIINKAVSDETTNRISQDLNAAWEIFLAPLTRSYPVLELVAGDEAVRNAVAERDVTKLASRLDEIQEVLNLDFVSIVVLGDPSFGIRYDGSMKGGASSTTSFIEHCISGKVPVSGITVLTRSFLMSEDPRLAEQARIAIVSTPRAEPRTDTIETEALATVTAFPIILNDVVVAVMYGGEILNRNYGIVDRIRDTVFRLETYRGFNVGTATIFFYDLRVATNVMNATGRRAIGTQVSSEVKQTVLGEGLRWTDRAFVVDNWYKTAYDPIEDLEGHRVGMLYVGVLEAKYLDYRREALSLFILIIVLGLVVAIILGYFLGSRMLGPINRLVDASRQVGEGHLEPDIGSISKGEIGVLQKMFLNMLVSFQERVQQQEDDSAVQLLQSEKQASVGRLAAGVAHEINNPLTSVLTFTHLLLERNDLPEDAVNDLKVISESTERVRGIVRGLLDYSRQEDLHQVPTDLNDLVESTVALVGNQIRKANKHLDLKPDDTLPLITVDRGQIQSVLINLLLNASDAVGDAGRISISTEISVSSDHPGKSGVDISVEDTGIGIPPEHLSKLFDPFFTTKEAGKGTGLGLAVSRSIVERHGGSIRVKSSPGAGSTFTLWLPFDTLESE